MENTCQKCEERAWSLMEKAYLEIFRQCWSCDKRAWEAKEISKVQFEERERVALEYSTANHPL